MRCEVNRYSIVEVTVCLPIAIKFECDRHGVTYEAIQYSTAVLNHTGRSCAWSILFTLFCIVDSSFYTFLSGGAFLVPPCHYHHQSLPLHNHFSSLLSYLSLIITSSPSSHLINQILIKPHHSHRKHLTEQYDVF